MKIFILRTGLIFVGALVLENYFHSWQIGVATWNIGFALILTNK